MKRSRRCRRGLSADCRGRTIGDERAGKIEIALPNGVRVKVNALVSEQALLRVLRAVKGAL